MPPTSSDQFSYLLLGKQSVSMLRSKERCDVINNALKEVRTFRLSPGLSLRMDSLSAYNFSRTYFHPVKFSGLGWALFLKSCPVSIFYVLYLQK